MANHNGRKFSAKDKDVDAANYKSDKWSGHCAQMFKGGWWYDNCHRADLNGMYLKGNNTLYGKGVIWYHWKGYYYSLKGTTMMVRREQNIDY